MQSLGVAFAALTLIGVTAVGYGQVDSVDDILRKHLQNQRVLEHCEIKTSVVQRKIVPPIGRVGQERHSTYRRDGDRAQLLLAVGPPEAPADWEFGLEDWERIDFTINTVSTPGATISYQRFADSSKDRVSRDPVSSWIRSGLWTFAWGDVGAPLRGFVEGDFEPLPATLQAANQVHLRPQFEELDGHRCRVIEANLDGSSYIVWFDTERGYNIVRAEVKRSWDCPFYDTTLWERLRASDRGEPDEPYPSPADESVTHTVILSDVKLDKFDGVWLPVEGVYTRTIRHRTGKTSNEQVRLRRTSVQLNPQFGPDAFTINAPDGTYAADLSYNDGIDREWRGGQIVEKIDMNAVNAMDRAVASAQESLASSSRQTPGSYGTFALAGCLALLATVVVVISAKRISARRESGHN